MKILIIILLIFSCEQSDNQMELIYHNHGVSQKINLSNDDLSRVNSILEKIYSQSTERLRFFLEQGRVDELIKNEQILEFRFTPKVTLTSSELGTDTFTNLLIPLTGDFIGSSTDPIITIFTGSNSEYSEPIRNRNGYKDVIKIKQIAANYLHN